MAADAIVATRGLYPAAAIDFGLDVCQHHESAAGGAAQSPVHTTRGRVPGRQRRELRRAAVMVGCVLPLVGAGLLLVGWAVALTTAGRLSAVIVYGVAAFLLWWAAFLMRRRRQILRAAAADLTCVDLDTGNVSKVTRADVDSDRTRALRPLLEKALRSGAAVTLPDDCPREVALKAKQDGSTLVFQILSAIDFETPLATATAVRSEAASQSAWWHLDALGDWAATDAELPARPPVPWCALYFPSMVIGGADPEDHPWLAVLAQQLTWCWDKHATVPRHYRTPRPGRSA